MRIVRDRKRLANRLHDLNDLMQIYEHNFIQLRQLIPNLKQLEGEYVSSLSKGMDLHLRILEQSPFTTTLQLTYLFDPSGEARREPNLTIRHYADARLAEVMSGHHPRRYRHGQIHHGLPSLLEEKWRLNRFLERWLGYCLHQGHQFHCHDRLVCPSEKGADCA